MKLLTESNVKFKKGEKFGWYNVGLHLAPVKLSGYQVCPMASAGCAAACLNTAGQGRYKNVQDARIRKTKWFFEDRETFMERLCRDIEAAMRKAERKEMQLAVRLNATSDIVWERLKYRGQTIIQRYSEVQFYDYTKRPNRRAEDENYHLTFSRSEENEHLIEEAFANGMNVAVVFGIKPNDDMIDSWRGRKVHDGDLHDLRWEDPNDTYIGLRAKGVGRYDQSGFVVHDFKEAA